MAETKRKYQPISKGSKHTILVEEAINDALIVCLEVGTKLFRGVLLDVNKRNLPHGVCFPFDNKQNGKPGTRSAASKDKSDTPSSQDVDIPSSVLRHTYHQDPSHMGAAAQKYASKSFRNNYKDKTVRNIRLRPRQTLCSKCKSACIDGEKGPVSVTNKQTKNNSTPKQRQNSTNHQKHSYMSPGYRNNHHTSPIQTRAKESCATVLTRQTLASYHPKKRRKMLLSRSVSLPVIKADVRKKNERSFSEITDKIYEKMDAEKTVENGVSMDTNGVDEKIENEVMSLESDLISVFIDKTKDSVDGEKNENCMVSVKLANCSSDDADNNHQSENCEQPTQTLSRIQACNVDNIESSDLSPVVKLDKSSVPVTKATPFIKISIGEGTVLKIPPRLHEEAEETDADPVSEVNGVEKEQNDENYTNHKKLRKAMKKAKEREKYKEGNTNPNSNQTIITTSSHHRKHKRKHKHKHSAPLPLTEPSESKEAGSIEDANEENDPEFSEKTDSSIPNSPLIGAHENTFEPISALETNLVPNLLEEHPPRSPLDVDSYSLISDASEPNQNCFSDTDFLNCVDIADTNDFNGDDDDDSHENGPPGDSSAFDSIRPLMMKIQTRNVTGCDTADGRTINVGDIVWGKIQGFPWWPGRVLSISMRQKDKGVVIQQLAHISWFGSSTMSHIQCSDLFPFLEDFKLRYNKKKKGTYKNAIKQATIAAQSITNVHHIDFSEFDL
ncbi:hypothetical protein ScPMuIL_007224 [Solemya velum]